MVQKTETGHSAGIVQSWYKDQEGVHALNPLSDLLPGQHLSATGNK